MNFLKPALIALAITTGFVSCKKDKDMDPPSPPAPPVIIGKWTGVFTNSGSPTTHFYSFNIKEGGVLEHLNQAGEKIGNGTWQLNGSTYTASYSNTFPVTSFSMIGTLENSTKLSGAWGQGNSQTNGGFWNMNKQP